MKNIILFKKTDVLDELRKFLKFDIFLLLRLFRSSIFARVYPKR